MFAACAKSKTKNRELSFSRCLSQSELPVYRAAINCEKLQDLATYEPVNLLININGGLHNCGQASAELIYQHISADAELVCLA
jgi:hypothetical protein